MARKLVMLGCQIDVPATPTQEARDAHVARVVAKVSRKLLQDPADLVVLPELATISYDRATFEQLSELAEALDGSSVRAFAALAIEHQTTVCFGMARVEAGEYLISQIVVGPDGELIGHYDKLHAAQFGFSMEKEFFGRGDRLLSFECNGVRVAPIICYDIRFPELCRTLALDHGVEAILHCSAFSRDESFDSWHSFVTTRAMENQVYVLGLSRAGPTFGDSLLCGPWVDAANPPVRFDSEAEDLRTIALDLDHLEGVRRSYEFLADRRGDWGDYAGLDGTHPR